MNVRQQFLTRFTVLADMCNRSLSPELIGYYENSLQDLGYENLSVAIDELIRNRGDRDPFPSIRSIREKIIPIETPENEAIEASNRIVQAISAYGYGRLMEARAFIGDLGWLIVQREGGWESLCERVQMNQIPTLKAQWRELGKALYARAKQGRLSEPPKLPAPENRGLKLIHGLSENLSLNSKK